MKGPDKIEKNSTTHWFCPCHKDLDDNGFHVRCKPEEHNEVIACRCRNKKNRSSRNEEVK